MTNKYLLETLLGSILLALSTQGFANIQKDDLESKLTSTPEIETSTLATLESKDYNKKAEKYIKQTNFLKAKKTLEQAMKDDPNAETYFLMGLLHLKKSYAFFLPDEIEEAIKYFNKSLELNINNPRTWLELGNCYYDKIEYPKYDVKECAKKALDCYKKAKDLNPKFAEAYKAIGLVYLGIYQDIEKSEENLRKAEKNFRTALDINQKIAHAHFGLSEIYYEKCEYYDAVIEIEKALSIDPIAPVYIKQQKKIKEKLKNN